MATLKGIGTEDRKKVAIAGALGIVVLLLAIHTIFGGSDAPAPSASSVAAPAPLHARTPSASERRAGSRAADLEEARSEEAAGAAPPPVNSSMDPRLHPELMAENENYLYVGNGRNIFSQTSGPAPLTPIEKVKGAIRPSMQTAAVNTGPPPPPTIDLKFFGYTMRKSGTRRAFLMHGDDVFVAAEGDVVSHRYRVVRIAPFSIDVEDLPYHDTQTLPLIQN